MDIVKNKKLLEDKLIAIRKHVNSFPKPISKEDRDEVLRLYANMERLHKELAMYK